MSNPRSAVGGVFGVFVCLGGLGVRMISLELLLAKGTFQISGGSGGVGCMVGLKNSVDGFKLHQLLGDLFISPTPWKINMEAKNHPFEKENHLPNHRFQVPCESSRVYDSYWGVDIFHHHIGWYTFWGGLRVGDAFDGYTVYSVSQKNQPPSCFLFATFKMQRGNLGWWCFFPAEIYSPEN